MTIKEAAREHMMDVHVTFSLGDPFAVELWQAIPGTPLATPGTGCTTTPRKQANRPPRRTPTPRTPSSADLASERTHS
ncbi:hypothetical protein Sme01_63780 [Sphaerisporangium melleum]|uniref:Uncharacterized protein n=1 Tax=Sphaerisporangium melleum TaxID=321316 RepID=A0A917VPL4_9ACTN|nr:hypothetical protein GCM10007964_54430 [Sphaerisporangium melleum]GII73902.1 hypothetical protein Sme01_63780 [Sphaerisporangium melleum]